MGSLGILERGKLSIGEDMRKIASAIVCVGLAGIAAYMNVHQQSATLLWLGVAIAFFVAC
jgi:hypothetical protein